MRGYSKIIDKTETIGVISGVDFNIDTKGLSCVIKVVGGSMGIKPHNTDNTHFLLDDGETIDICGKATLRFVSGSPSIYCLYYHLL